MSVIIRDGGFRYDEWKDAGGSFVPLQELQSMGGKPANSNALLGLDIEPSVVIEDLVPLVIGMDAVRIDFPSFADGRGFSIAKHLREAGFEGLIRARGHLLCDQYPLAIRCGINEVEIDAQMAKRQPEQYWRDAFERVERTYGSRLGANQVEHSAA